MVYCTESDPAAVYSAVKTDDISYGQIVIKDKQKQSKTKGTSSLVSEQEQESRWW